MKRKQRMRGGKKMNEKRIESRPISSFEKTRRDLSQRSRKDSEWNVYISFDLR